MGKISTHCPSVIKGSLSDAFWVTGLQEDYSHVFEGRGPLREELFGGGVA